VQEDEVLIVMIPRVVRLPEWTKANLRPMFSGTDTFVGAKRELDVKAPTANPNPQATQPGSGAGNSRTWRGSCARGRANARRAARRAPRKFPIRKRRQRGRASASSLPR